jgi:hypothetical protein
VPSLSLMLWLLFRYARFLGQNVASHEPFAAPPPVEPGVEFAAVIQAGNDLVRLDAGRGFTV